MIIVGFEDEYTKALEHVKNVNWSVTKTPSKTFETCIRYLGGMMSAYDLRPNFMLLQKSMELMNQVLLPAFYTSDGVPASYVNVSE